MSKNTKLDSFCQLLSKFSKTYASENNEKILKQYLKIKQIINLQPSLQFSSILNKEFCLYEEECQVINTQASYLLKDNWSTVINKDDLLIQTSKTVQQFLIKLQFSVCSDILQVTSVFYESDLIGDWMKAIKSSRTLETISIYRKKIQNFYNLPWPLNDRFSVLNVRFYPMPELNSVLILSYTPSENIENPVNEENYIEMVLPSASLWIKSNGDSCVVVILFQANKYIVLFI